MVRDGCVNTPTVPSAFLALVPGPRKASGPRPLVSLVVIDFFLGHVSRVAQ